jgi:hypothetical protein
METAEVFLPVFWVAFAPIVVIVLAIGVEWIGDQTGRPDINEAATLLLSLSNLRALISVD